MGAGLVANISKKNTIKKKKKKNHRSEINEDSHKEIKDCVEDCVEELNEDAECHKKILSDNI